MPAKISFMYPIRLKFGIWSASNRVSIINQCECGNMCGLVLATPTGSCFGCQKLINGQTRQKFE